MWIPRPSRPRCRSALTIGHTTTYLPQEKKQNDIRWGKESRRLIIWKRRQFAGIARRASKTSTPRRKKLPDKRYVFSLIKLLFLNALGVRIDIPRRALGSLVRMMDPPKTPMAHGPSNARERRSKTRRASTKSRRARAQ